MMEPNVTPTVGSMVHFVVGNEKYHPALLSNGLKSGDVLPAIIVRVWGTHCVNLRVICDAPYDVWLTSVNYDSTGSPYTWHFLS